MTKNLTYTVHLTEAGVSMGDHAQDVTKALSVAPDATIQDLVNKALNDPAGLMWSNDGGPVADPKKFLTIRAEVNLDR